MKLLKYLKKNGFKKTWYVIYNYKINILFEKIINKFLRNKPLEKKIIIESHNDFDCNGGAFYNYLIKNNYNTEYKIIWLIKNKLTHKLPNNVKCISLYGPSIKKSYHICTAKYLIFDNDLVNKVRYDQIMVYCGHGSIGLKNVAGKMNVPDYVDFILSPSEKLSPIIASQRGTTYNANRIIPIGYPFQDVFFDKEDGDLNKIVDKEYKKVFLWMPTFRMGGGFDRNDSERIQPLGIPLINTLEEYYNLNKFLKKEDCLLIIKIHPMQNLINLKIDDLSNIKVLTGKKVKDLNIDNYRLMKSVDSLISDYSAAAGDFLLLNRPLAYVLDDMNEYKLGFISDDIHEFIAGHEIYKLEDFYIFLNDIIDNKDIYKKKREELLEYCYDYKDGNACSRLAELLDL